MAPSGHSNLPWLSVVGAVVVGVGWAIGAAGVVFDGVDFVGVAGEDFAGEDFAGEDFAGLDVAGGDFAGVPGVALVPEVVLTTAVGPVVALPDVVLAGGAFAAAAFVGVTADVIDVAADVVGVTAEAGGVIPAVAPAEEARAGPDADDPEPAAPATVELASTPVSDGEEEVDVVSAETPAVGRVPRCSTRKTVAISASTASTMTDVRRTQYTREERGPTGCSTMPR